jgi:hypothetical protein
MRKIIRKLIEFAVALKDGASPTRQRADKTVWRGRVRAKTEPRSQGASPDGKRLDLGDKMTAMP